MKNFLIFLILIVMRNTPIAAQLITDSLDIDITHVNVSFPYRKYYQDHCSIIQREKFQKLVDSLEGRFVHIQLPKDEIERIGRCKIYYDYAGKTVSRPLCEFENQLFRVLSVSAFKIRFGDTLLLRPIIKTDRIDVDNDNTIYGFPVTTDVLSSFKLDMTKIKQEREKSETLWPTKGDYYYSKVSNASKNLGIKYKVMDCMDYDRSKGTKKIILSSSQYNDSILILKSPMQFYRGFMALRYWKIFQDDCINKIEQRNEKLQQLYKGKYVFACSSDLDSINFKVIDLYGNELNESLSKNKDIFEHFSNTLKQGCKARVNNVVLHSNNRIWGYNVSCTFSFCFVTQNIIDKKYHILIESNEAICKQILTPWQQHLEEKESYIRGKKESEEFFMRMADKYGYDYEPRYSNKNNNRKVYVAASSYAYHRTKACVTLRRSSWIGTISVKDAKRQNLKPCRVCW